nr:glycosyltransferase family 4 protein [uncultured Rhodoferax sp.]
MNLVLISHGFQPEYESGFANGLAINGVAPTLVAADRTLFARLHSSVRAINLRGSQDRSRPSWKKALNLGLYALRLAALLAWRRPVVHLTGLLLAGRSNSWPIECQIYRLLSKQLVLTVHNVVPHGQDTPEMRRTMAKVYSIPDCLVVHTAKAKQRLIDEFAVNAERIVVMEHGIEKVVDVPENITRSVRDALAVPAQGKLVLFFGAVLPYKGVDLLIAAARHLRDGTRVHIAGRCGDRQYQQELEALLDQHPDQTTITWENTYLSEERASVLLAAAEVLVMPYRHIDQSGVLFSALSHGVPVVAFDVGSLREYLVSGVGQVVPPGDILALANAIDAAPHSESVRNGIKTVAQKFVWQETVKPVLQCYAK